ncbi:MAG TPA: glycoside hydrolase family 88 protein [Bryobacteraceae bacterium]|nr:glycoside hydrolase family 88 protein [Bryobacteraceae bacterium]
MLPSCPDRLPSILLLLTGLQLHSIKRAKLAGNPAMRSVQMTIAACLSVGILAHPLAGAETWDVGLTGKGTLIEAAAVPGSSAAVPTVLLVGGLAGEDRSAAAVTREVQAFEATKPGARRFRLIAIALANPDRAAVSFPPAGTAYRDNPESHALWRWIGIQAPDLVLVAGDQDFGLAEALSQNAVAGVGRISARAVPARPGILRSVKTIPPSEAHHEIERRLRRTPRQLAEELAQYYGHDFDQAAYIQAVALIGQLRLGHQADVERLVSPFVDGSKDSLARPTSPTLAGHLVFAALAERTHDDRYLRLVRKTADLGFTASGEMKESMPLHEEMSDSVFMACPILASAGKLTGETRYFDMAARHFSFMQKLCLRTDGLYRHSPLTDAAWGRGNAFPALGLAWALSDFPEQHPQVSRMVRAFQDHMAELARFQDSSGMWREVIDQRGAYPEFSATAMIAAAMLRGIEKGWLEPASYRPRVDRAWRAILTRTGADGRLIDVCESTGKQKTLGDYLRRAAILDRDPRGGAMAMLLATELAGSP